MLTISAAGCASTATIETAWRAPSAPQLTNVVTLSPAPDEAVRRSTEDKLAQQLYRHGVRAVPGYSVLSDQDLSDRNRMVSTLRDKGFDGIVAMRVVDAHQKLVVYPGFYDYWGGAWGYGYGYGWGGAWGATVVPETVVQIEVNAYTLSNNQLVFSTLSRSVDPDSVSQALADVSKIATDKLAQDRVVAPTQTAMK